MKTTATLLLGVAASASATTMNIIPGLQLGANPSHYGDPATGCEDDEQAVQVTGLDGDFCSPACTGALKRTCPSDVPDSVTATPTCALQTTGGDKYCALVCSPATDERSLRAGDAACGTGTCQAISGTGICTYAAAEELLKEIPMLAFGANPTHFGDPATGCEDDEQAVQVTGLDGDFCSPACTGALKRTCPSDVPASVTATPTCALQTTGGDKYCALVCSPATDFFSLRAGDAACGTGTCQAISGTGICTYAAATSLVSDMPVLELGANPTHYGDPSTGCEDDEQSVQVQGVDGDFCSPACDASNACPADIPDSVTATPTCALQSPTGDKYCALVCSPATDFFSLRAGDAQCGTGSCQAISGVGLCTYAAAK